VEAGTSGEGAALASFPLVVVGTASYSFGGHDMGGRCSGLCTVGRRRLSQTLCLRARMVSALLWPLFALSDWAEAGTVVAGTKVEGAALISVR
jgi:hypothetical protein